MTTPAGGADVVAAAEASSQQQPPVSKQSSSLSSWAKKLEFKLSGLSENSSKESIQTLAKWIGFNRKHGRAFVEVLNRRLQEMSTSNNAKGIIDVTLSVIHQVLLLHGSSNNSDNNNNTSTNTNNTPAGNTNASWDKLLDLRVLLGELVLIPNAPQIGSILKKSDSEKVMSYTKEWDSLNAFGGPTLLHQWKRELAAGVAAAEEKAQSPPQQRQQQVEQRETEKSTTTSDESRPQGNELKDKKKDEVEAKDTVQDDKKDQSSVATPHDFTKDTPQQGSVEPLTMTRKAEDTKGGGTESTATNLMEVEESQNEAESMLLPSNDDHDEQHEELEHNEVQTVTASSPSKGTPSKEDASTTETTDGKSSTKKSTLQLDHGGTLPVDSPVGGAIAITTTASTTTAGVKASKKSQQQSLAPQQQSTPAPAAASYDFESKGIPQAPVKMKELQDPCRSLATFQIARDLRNDSAQQLASLLAELPESVRQYTSKLAQDKDPNDPDNNKVLASITDDKARDWSIQTSDVALDLNISEQMSNLRTFREVVEKQRKARQLLIYLLIRSRCQFGSKEAAQAFDDALRAVPELQRRKQVLLDAMDLEGLELGAGGTSGSSSTTTTTVRLHTAGDDGNFVVDVDEKDDEDNHLSKHGSNDEEDDKTRADLAEQELQQAQQLTLSWWKQPPSKGKRSSDSSDTLTGSTSKKARTDDEATASA